MMDSLRTANALGVNLLRMAESRLELFSAELQREKSRAALLMACVCLGSGCVLLGLTALLFTAIVLTPVDYRWITALAGALIFGLGASICALIALQSALRGSRPFAETSDELKKDALCLKDLVKNSE